jgi:hypothetical protein
MDCRLKWGNIARIRFWILLGPSKGRSQLSPTESPRKRIGSAEADTNRAGARPRAPDRGNPAFTYSYNVQFVSSDLVTLFTHPNRSTIPPRMTRPYLSAVSSCPSIAHGLSDEAYAAGGTW